MRNLTFSNSFIIAACLHGLVIFMLGPKQVHTEPPPLPMLHVKIGTSFGNAEQAEATDQKTLLAAAPQQEKQEHPVELPDLEPATGEPPPVATGDSLQLPANKDENTPEAESIHIPPPQPPVVLPSPPPAEQQTSAIGSPLGNDTAPNAQDLVRYSQLVGAWVNKFRPYPKEARRKNQEGTAVLLIVIDRTGKILRYELVQKTGYALLDEATLEMAKKANPVPAPPENYPSEDEMGFQITVKFSLME